MHEPPFSQLRSAFRHCRLWGSEIDAPLQPECTALLSEIDGTMSRMSQGNWQIALGLGALAIGALQRPSTSPKGTPETL
jgi:hypothetical protein